MTNIPRTGGIKDPVINDIIRYEWDMFQQTENIGGRASCQDQYDTFYANRYSQHNALELDTLESYRKDLAEAKAAGRNLITEKYAYMMEFTDPEYYKANLQAHLPALTDEKATLIAQIVSRQILGYREYAAKYPYMAGAGRPIEEGGLDTSIRQYSVGEFRTYSDDTLKLLLRDVNNSGNFVLDIQNTLISFYGYESLEAAEENQKKRG